MVLKGCFKILKKMTNYDLTTQVLLVTACFIIHNFIKLYDTNDKIFAHYADPNHALRLNNRSNDDGHNKPDIGDTESPLMRARRDEIVEMM